MTHDLIAKLRSLRFYTDGTGAIVPDGVLIGCNLWGGPAMPDQLTVGDLRAAADALEQLAAARAARLDAEQARDDWRTWALVVLTANDPAAQQMSTPELEYFIAEKFDQGVAAETQVGRLTTLLTQIRGWDMMDATADGPFWRREIDKALAPPARPQEPSP